MDIEINRLIIGLFFTLIFLFLSYLSFKSYRQDKLPLAIFFLIVLGFSLRLFCSCDFYLHSWDERYHALVAKNIFLHPLRPTLYENAVLSYDYKNWTANHVWLHKQPFTFWTI